MVGIATAIEPISTDIVWLKGMRLPFQEKHDSQAKLKLPARLQGYEIY